MTTPAAETALSAPRKKNRNGIGTLNEKSLHAALKQWYAEPGDRFEREVEGYHVDIVRGDLLIEIQTRGFGAIRRKLSRLSEERRVRLVYPVAAEKWILRQSEDGAQDLGRRKSPKRGRMEHLFSEMVSAPTLAAHRNFSLEVLLIQEEEVRRRGIARAWRRKGWATVERRLLGVIERRLIEAPAHLLAMIPAEVDEPFTTADIAEALGIHRGLAQQMAYCLRKLGAIAADGKAGNSILYRRGTPQ